MIFKKIDLPQGEKVNARVYNDDLTLFITKKQAVYKSIITNYRENAKTEPPYLFVYCDEVCGLPDGSYIERRGDKVKINN